MVLFLSNDDIDKALSWSDVVSACEDMLLERGRDTAWFSPRQRYVLPTDSRMMILPGGLKDANVMGARVYSMNTRTSPDSKNYVVEDVLSAYAMNVIFDMKSAEMLAITAGERINTLRVAGELAIGAKYLAKEDAKTVGVLGCGRLALGSLLALRETRDIERIKVYSRTPERRHKFADQLSELTDLDVIAVQSSDEVLRDADILISATSSMEAAFDGRKLEPGTHVCTVGGEVLAGGWELDEHALSRMSVVSVLNKKHAMEGGLGLDPPNRTYGRGVEMGAITWDNVVEIADVMSGKAKGRQSRDDITAMDNRAMGTSDVTLAKRAYDAAKEKGFGTELPWGSGLEPDWR